MEMDDKEFTGLYDQEGHKLYFGDTILYCYSWNQYGWSHGKVIRGDRGNVDLYDLRSRVIVPMPRDADLRKKLT